MSSFASSGGTVVQGGEPNLRDFYATDVERYPVITTLPPCTNALKYAHILITTSNIAASIEFYGKIGFNISRSSSNMSVLRNMMGFEIHLVLCRKPLDDGKNVLMDFPSEKYPGHTHFACTVPSVIALRTYLNLSGIPLR
jgi:hypothetical protein